MGNLYRDGDPRIIKSAKKAAKIYKRAVELGNVDAMLSLGLLKMTGDGVKVDRKMALQLWRIMAADRGSERAQYNLGLAKLQDMREGGVEKADMRAYFTEARAWLGLAAAAGHREARAELARQDRQINSMTIA